MMFNGLMALMSVTGAVPSNNVTASVPNSVAVANNLQNNGHNSVPNNGHNSDRVKGHGQNSVQNNGHNSVQSHMPNGNQVEHLFEYI